VALPLFGTHVQQQNVCRVARETLHGEFEIRYMGDVKMRGIFRVQLRSKPASVFRFAYQQNSNRHTVD
jgi:hypothetical protein